jgi:CO/xanthine dehydrogenase Mo-binding subunit
MSHRLIGTAVLRKEVAGKVTGKADYVDDLHFPGVWHGITVRSTIPRGHIRKITFLDGVPWSEFAVVTAKDIPGKNIVSLIVEDQPYLASETVNHMHEPIVLLAHPDKYLLEKARSLVKIDYEPLATIYDIDEALRANQVIKQYLMEKGDVDAVWPQAAHIFEGEYSTGAQEQLYIEPNGMIATFDGQEGVTVRGSMQCPYYIQKALMPLFDLPAEKIRVIQQETGGAFGGKEEYPSMIAGHAALLAWKSGHPVKIIYDREEDMAATTKRHPSRTRHKTAIAEDGTLLAMDIEFVIDGGAYATLSAVVLSRGTIHAAGPYRCPNVRVRSTAVFTNSPPHGAFRGFGAPQSIFALERQIDKIARGLNIAPEVFRERNFLQTGDTTATGQVIEQPLNLAALQERALNHSRYFMKKAQFRQSNKTATVKKGIGFATFFHGAGFTGSGERYLQSVAKLRATPDGKVQILCSMTEMGQGTNTVLTQVAAETLNIPYEWVTILRPDTALVPNSGPTVASRTTMIIGKLVENAANRLRDKLALRSGCSAEEFAEACAVHGPLEISAQYKEPGAIYWDDQKYRGDAYGAYAWAVYVAEVSVDTLTGETSVDHFTALQEVGRVLHPVLAAGQIEGGVLQGIGFALYEKVKFRDGAMINNQMTNYIVPTSMDAPPISVLFEEIPYEHGALGAKGIGELPMDGPAPAILNAIEDALNVSFQHVPLMPEEILERCVA